VPAMTNLEHLVHMYPDAFHVTCAGHAQWIMRHGLYCADQLLDLFEATDAQRAAAHDRPRRTAVALNTHPLYGKATIRDQGPLDLKMLKRVLNPDTSIAEWLALLDSLVFLWPTTKRVRCFLQAEAYAEKQHDVIVLETAQLIARHGDRLLLSRLNSGATRSIEHKRGRDTFWPLDDPRTTERLRGGRRDRAVAEIAVPGGVSDASEFAIRIERWYGPESDHVLWERDSGW
jgi:hypothetical protein